MIRVQPFRYDVLSTHKVFFLLNKIPKGTKDIDIFVDTPTGPESIDFVDVFKMFDDSLLAAWRHPLQKLGLQNLVASANGHQQILNLYPVERIIDVYNKPVTSDFGVFTFAKSNPIPNGDWRCDRGYYGASRFKEDFAQPMVSKLEDIIMYEAFLSVGGAGHLIYIEVAKNTDLANDKLNNSVIPTTGRTLQEALRLVYEWSVLADEPFNSNSDAAIACKKFITALDLSEQEIAEIENITPMQISQFLTGSETARVRPDNILELSTGIADIVFNRMAASSLSFIVSRNPEICDLDEVLTRELAELNAGIDRFRTFYGIPIDISLEDRNIVAKIADFWAPTQEAYVHNQLRNFENKRVILDEISRRQSSTH